MSLFSQILSTGGKLLSSALSGGVISDMAGTALRTYMATKFWFKNLNYILLLYIY
jgi:hypothetical protein